LVKSQPAVLRENYMPGKGEFWAGWALALGVSILLASMALGQTADYWLNPNGGNYEDGSNWSLGAPGAYPIFNLGSAGYTITLNQNDGAIDPYVETDNPILNLNNFTYTEEYLDVCTAAGTNGSLTLLGPGTLQDFEGAIPSYIDVGNGTGTGSLIVNGATVNQSTPDSSIATGDGTLIVENGGTVEQTHSPDQTMNLGGNLIVNDGTVKTEASISLGSANISNGSTVESTGAEGGPPGIGMTLSGNVVVDNSMLSSRFGMVFDPGATLTVLDGAGVGGSSTVLPGLTDDIFGVIAGDSVTFGSTLTMQLDLYPIQIVENGITLTEYSEIAVTGSVANPSGVLNLVFPGDFAPSIGDDFHVFDWADGVSGAFSEINTPVLPSGESWDLNDVYTTGMVSIVPEPSNIALMLAAGGLFLRCQRKMRRL
jgi:hypothetical protein